MRGRCGLPPSRRAFLRQMLVGAGSAALWPIFNASGAEPLTPRRLILFFTPHATFWPAWQPTVIDGQLRFGPILSPLAAHRDKVNVLTGVRMRPSKYFSAHSPGGAQLWTGSELDRGTRNDDGSYNYGDNTGPSVDQIIAKAVGAATTYPSLQFGCWTGQTTIFSAPSRPLFPAQDPQQAFARLFSNVSSGARENSGSVLDLVAGELKGLAQRLPAADRIKLDAHLTAVGALQTRLSNQTRACGGPMLTPEANDPTRLEAMLDIVTAALTCDLTRVISIQFGQQDNDSGPYPFLNVSAGHHPLTHLSPSDVLDDQGQRVTDQSKSVNGQLTRIYTWYTTMFAGLLDRLSQVPEGSGTLLDNTLVVWGSELADFQTHLFEPSMPFVLAGGAGGALRTGRLISLDKTPQDHNRLLVSICQLMGLSGQQTFGNMDVGSGVLPGLM